MNKKDKPLKVTWEYEETPDGEERLLEIYEFLLSDKPNQINWKETKK